MNSSNKKDINDGISASLPIVLGYFPVAMAFGMLSGSTNITLIESISFSVFVYAGASQFIAANMILSGAGAFEIILTTALLNFRHFLMSASLAPKLYDIKRKWLPFFAFGITDETFSVASFTERKLTGVFLAVMSALPYLSWISGTAAGYLAGSFLPNDIQKSMTIGLYALFAAILMPKAKKSRNIMIIAILSALVNTLLGKLNLMPQSWNLVITVVALAFLASILFKDDLVEKPQQEVSIHCDQEEVADE